MPRVVGWTCASVLCLVVATLIVSRAGGQSSASRPPEPRSTAALSAAADRFLATYVTNDGRVLRHDQGGDIVSEGQAYGMLIAEVADRPATVRTIWAWTSAHLMRSDGLISYHADGSGQILDPNSAADADVLSAYALLRYTGSHKAGLHAAGRMLAAAVLAGEAITQNGAPVMVAGPWAMSSPETVNPSYWMPGVFGALARFTGDKRWHEAATAAVRLLSQVTGSERLLPSDWAQLSGGRLQPIGTPDGSAPVQYGLDAQRGPLWFGTACSATAKRLASTWWHRLSVDDRGAMIALSLSGQPVNQGKHPLPLMAAAAAASVAGHATASRALRRQAVALAGQSPTYYGDAWVTLGRALLNHRLDPCHEGPQHRS